MGSDLSPSLRLSSHAIATTKNGLRNSDGCTWPIPKLIQRFAPFTSGPTTGTKISSTRKNAAPNRDSRRARSRGIIEIPIITGMPRPIQASWRQK